MVVCGIRVRAVVSVAMILPFLPVGVHGTGMQLHQHTGESQSNPIFRPPCLFHPQLVDEYQLSIRSIVNDYTSS